MMSAWLTGVEGTWVPSCHATCTCNEVAALLKRSLGCTPTPLDSRRGDLSASFGWLRSVAAGLGVSPVSHRDIVLGYKGRMRTRYEEAERSLLEDGPVVSADARLGAFLKAEKFNGMQKVAKPRMIFPRSYRYNLELATRLKPFEHALWPKLRAPKRWGVPRTRVVGKGLGPRARASLVVKKFEGIGAGCVCFEVDASSWEAHQDEWQLVEEHRIYAAAFPGDSQLQSLLAKQLRNKGVTSGGVKFSRVGGRASGDLNTGMGNTLLMLAICDSVLRRFGLSKYDLLVDGDNALIFLPGSEATPVIEGFHQRALECSGHEMVLERPVTVIEEVRFGQSAPVCVDGVWTMCRDYRKIFSQGTSSHVHLRHRKFALSFLRGVALCELSLAQGLPLVQVWADLLRQATEGSPAASPDFYRDYLEIGATLSESVSMREVSITTRESFSRAFGISVEDQLLVERSLVCELRLSEGSDEDAPTLDNWYSASPGLVEPWLDERI
uniref:RNA-directed RNA polymerase n=1 Tax=Plasmopara viticola lesion associated ambiguivirus 2 TaxID=2692083 RepID=A0A6B9Q469_9VIRU|nr:RdRp [Plasmopara viticola lesion associated ambiguivirus 2]